MKTSQPHALALAISALLATLAQPVLAQQSSEIGKITVTGEGDKLGTGLIIDEDTPKAKSTITKAQIEKSRSSSNPFQALALLPGVNSASFDATGLFGGNLRVRGFNSDQMGLTINGAPVNDSGNFAVYPQEYSDMENMCEMFVTQGATDTDAPHVGASGGNVGLTTCAPEDKFRVRVAQSLGQLSYTRSFLRVDTGLLGDFKGYASFSKSQVDKWKGAGQADRDHIDAAAEYKLGASKLSASLLYNRAINNNFRTLTLDQANQLGYNTDFSSTIPQHLPAVKGTAQNEATLASTSTNAGAYYGYSLNPFENALLTTHANLQLDAQTRLDIEPYYWYGYGTGGTQQTTLAESSGGTRLGGGIADINHDGDTLDTVMIYRGSVTQTQRPGVNVKLSHTMDNHKLLGGLWLERARHRQTQPATTLGNDGSIGDLWLRDNLLARNDGALYQGRDWLTISTGKSVFVQDTMDLLDSKLQLIPGLSWRSIQRDFSNYAAFGSGYGADYQVSRTYSQLLPSLAASYQLGPQTQGFASVSKNSRAPSNFELAGAVTSASYTNGAVSSSTVAINDRVKQETSVNVDVGARFKNDDLKASATAFLVKFKDRIASAFDPASALRLDMNVGDSTMKGFELELGTVPVQGFSGYSSLTYTKSTVDQDLLFNAGTVSYLAATSGKLLPDTPKWMAGLAGQYAAGPYMLNLQVKYTGERQVTLVNDQSIPGFVTLDLNAAYQFENIGVFKKPTLRLNVSNLLNKQYYLANSGSGSNFTVNATGTGGSAPSLYMGAPRFSSVTFQVDF
jgi:iron complex outermembrane receptor protein